MNTRSYEICAPFAGILRFAVADGSRVDTGDILARIEAVKLEVPVIAPCPGIVCREIHEDFVDVTGGDLLLFIQTSA